MDDFGVVFSKFRQKNGVLEDLKSSVLTTI